jgi:hypothetical protein
VSRIFFGTTEILLFGQIKMPSKMGADKWPHVNFYDVRTGRKMKVHKDDIKLKRGTTKHGVKYYQAIAMEPGKLDYDLYKFLSEEKYDMLKAKMAGKSHKKSKKSKKSKEASRCNRTKSGKRVKKSKCKKPCSWVKRKSSRGKVVRKGYCKKPSKKSKKSSKKR